ncbi:MAG: transglycosylase domain-containing protein [Candidatus Peregrinibacteria bacterium]
MRIPFFLKNLRPKPLFLLALFFAVLLFFVWVFSPLFFTPVPSFALPNSHFYDKNGVLLWTVPKDDLAAQEPIAYAEIDPTFLTLLISKEDENFGTNGGVEFSKKVYLLWQYIRGNGSRGGSTITEQWIKNKYFRESPRTLWQKGREAVLAGTLSFTTPKEKILEEYLSFAYFGRGSYGVKAASQVYFKKQFADLNFLEKCFLVTLLSRPQEGESLAKNFGKYKPYFLRIAEEKQLLPLDRIAAYAKEDFILPDKELVDFPVLLRPFLEYSQDEMKKQGIAIEKGGQEVFTTLDKHWQETTEKIVLDELVRLRANAVHDAGVIILDAKTGAIRTMVGTTRPEDKNVGKINTVLLPRPISSTIKPFLYLFLFLTTSAHPRDIVEDKKTEFPLPDGTKYIPQNFKGEEFGKIALEEALANSANISAVKVLDRVGVAPFYNFLTSLGFSFPFPAEHYGLSLALGTAEVSVLNLASVASIFVHHGERVLPYSTMIKNPLVAAIPPSVRLETALFWILSALNSDALRQRVFTYSGIFNTGRNFSIKTGTSANFRDNWTLGISDDLIIVVWTGNIDNSKMEEVSGVDGAGKIFAKILEALDLRGEKPKKPEHLKNMRVCKRDTNITKKFVPDLSKCAEQWDTTVEE